MAYAHFLTHNTASSPISHELRFTLFIALFAHIIIILLINFLPNTISEPHTQLDITLLQQNNEKPNETASMQATFTQAGDDQSNEIETNDPAQSLQTSNQNTKRISQPIAQHTVASDQPYLSTQTSIQNSAMPNEQNQSLQVITSKQSVQQRPLDNQMATSATSLLQHSLQIASDEARQPHYYNEASTNRKKILTTASTMRTSEAYYVDAWLKKVESLGNLNYPKISYQQSIYGSLRLYVSIQSDGSLTNVKLLQSSGHKILDDTAIQIVELAAPYAPFPDEMKKDLDELIIIRTWQFRKNNHFANF